jgi:hypothetical protein
MALRNVDVSYRQQLDVLLQQRYFDVVIAFSIENGACTSMWSKPMVFLPCLMNSTLSSSSNNGQL